MELGILLIFILAFVIYCRWCCDSRELFTSASDNMKQMLEHAKESEKKVHNVINRLLKYQTIKLPFVTSDMNEFMQSSITKDLQSLSQFVREGGDPIE